MIVIDPNESSHLIKVIPRTYNVVNDHLFVLKDEDLRTETNISNTKELNNGYIDYSINLTTTEGKSYSIKIVDSVTELVVWRGKMFTTSQTTQKYRINE